MIIPTQYTGAVFLWFCSLLTSDLLCKHWSCPKTPSNLVTMSAPPSSLLYHLCHYHPCITFTLFMHYFKAKVWRWCLLEYSISPVHTPHTPPGYSWCYAQGLKPRWLPWLSGRVAALPKCTTEIQRDYCVDTKLLTCPLLLSEPGQPVHLHELRQALENRHAISLSLQNLYVATLFTLLG